MKTYLTIQTIVFAVAAGFVIYGEYQTNDGPFKRRRDLYSNIGIAIAIIFLLDVFAMICFMGYMTKQ